MLDTKKAIHILQEMLDRKGMFRLTGDDRRAVQTALRILCRQCGEQVPA